MTVKKKNLLVFLFFLFITAVVFRPYFLKNLIPFPANLLVSYYEPWLSYPSQDYPHGAPNKPSGFDNLRIYYPIRSLTTRLLRLREVPLWNPYYFSGNTLLATYQSAVFHPAGILFLLLPAIDAWSVLIILQPILTGMGMYFFLRKLSLSTSASLLGALTLAFSGFAVVWWEEAYIYGWSGLFLPWGLLAAEKLFERYSIRSFSLLVVILAGSVFSGSFQIAIYVWLFTVLWVIYRSRQKPTNKRFLLSCAGAAGIALLIASVQLIPSIEAYRYSSRPLADVKYEFDTYLFPLTHVLTLLAPDFYGNPGAYNYFGKVFYHERMIYIHTVPLLLLLAVLLKRKPRHPHERFFAVAFLILLSFAFALPTSWLLYYLKIPFLSAMTPSRIAFLSTFSAAALVGFAVEQFWRGIPKKPLAFASGLGTITLGILWTIVFYVRSIKPDAEIATVSLRNLVLPTAFFIISLLIIWIGTVSVRWRRVAFGGMVVIFMVSILFFTNKYLYFSDRRLVFPQTPVLENLTRIAGIDRFWTYENGYIENNFGMQYELFSPEGFDSINIHRYGALLAYARSHGNEVTAVTRADARITSTDTFDDILADPYRKKLLSLLGVRYILARNTPDRNTATIIRNDPKLSPVWSDNAYTIFEYKDALPRAFLAYDAAVVQDDTETLRKLFDPGTDLSKTLILEKSVNVSARDENGAVAITRYTPNRVELSVTTKEPALLFMSDNYYPGWTVTIDGKRGTIHRANYTFRATVVPEGNHAVVFSYRPGTFIAGFVGTFLGGVLLLCLNIRARISGTYRRT